jgi:hypothetical protein
MICNQYLVRGLEPGDSGFVPSCAAAPGRGDADARFRFSWSFCSLEPCTCHSHNSMIHMLHQIYAIDTVPILPNAGTPRALLPGRVLLLCQFPANVFRVRV